MASDAKMTKQEEGCTTEIFDVRSAFLFVFDDIESSKLIDL